MLYICVNCFVGRGCAVSRRYINVCNCDMFSVLNVYLDHLKFCVVCINGRWYVCYGECYVVSNRAAAATLIGTDMTYHFSVDVLLRIQSIYLSNF